MLKHKDRPGKVSQQSCPIIQNQYHVEQSLPYDNRLGKNQALILLSCPTLILSCLIRNTPVRFKAELGGQGLSTDSKAVSNLCPVSGNMRMRKRLMGGTVDVNAELGINARQMLGGSPSETLIPIHSSLDIGSPDNQPSPLQYRLGIHQVWYMLLIIYFIITCSFYHS